ncbi:uncharacterized protein scimp [Parambassis ranga]|uniref:Uncharacterized protein LOC114446023 n=1 Tax=Parambassis ranga TaxID=210632 RepID=A0A6P7JK30_9TELE|nr:uncharacterized protein LOC114446023 [Parambassis ranga]XP_028277215.1 uncharacterized protein LOC114446023 [Parambassis ranga]
MDPLRKLLLLLIIGIIFVSGVIGIIFFIINKCLFRRGKHRISQLQKGSSFNTESNKYYIKDSEAAVPPLPPRTQFLTAEAQSYENLAEADYEQSIHDYQQDVPDYVQSIDDYQQDVHDYEKDVPDYVQDAHDYEQDVHDYEQDVHDYEQDVHDYEQDVHDYEQDVPDYVQSIDDPEQDVHDYEEAADQQPDYVAVEDETFPPLLPYNHSDPNMILAQSYENLAEEADYLQALDEQPDYVRADDEVDVFPPPPPAEDPAADGSASEDYDDIGVETQDEEDYDDVA